MNKKGITLIALTIIILVLVILTGTSVYFGFRALHKTNNFKVYSNLSLLYPKLEEYAEKYNFNPQDNDLPGYELTSEMITLLADNGISTASNLWRFLTIENINEMGLPDSVKEPNTNLLVDYQTMEIFYTKGYRKDDGTYTYRYSEMRAIEKNI